MINTVNVIALCPEMSVLKMASFEETLKGNSQAEKFFLRCIEESFPGTFQDENLRSFYLDEGIFESGGYTVLLVHSTEIGETDGI
jgi:hypothetical protein